MADHSDKQSPTQNPRSESDRGSGEVVWQATAGCAECDIRQRTLFSALRDSDLERLRGSICSAAIPNGAVLFREDQAADAIYTLGRGLIKLTKQGPAGERIVRLLGPGAAVGLEAYSGGHYRHSAVAMRPSDVCRVPLDLLQGLQRQNGALAEQVLAQWEQQLESADRWLAELGQGVASERMERLIAILAEMQGADGPLVQLLPTADLASILGITRESVSRALAELRHASTLKQVAPHIYEYRLAARH
jgi:CRP-like cAMP-binding protein